jgi:hypothetical protein
MTLLEMVKSTGLRFSNEDGIPRASVNGHVVELRLASAIPYAGGCACQIARRYCSLADVPLIDSDLVLLDESLLDTSTGRIHKMSICLSYTVE